MAEGTLNVITLMKSTRRTTIPSITVCILSCPTRWIKTSLFKNLTPTYNPNPRLLRLERRTRKNYRRFCIIVEDSTQNVYLKKNKKRQVLEQRFLAMHPSPGLLSKFSRGDMQLLLLDKTKTHYIGEDETCAFSKTIANCAYIIIYFPQSFLGINCNTGWGTSDRLLVVQFTINEVMSS